jgi:hypothetical protein
MRNDGDAPFPAGVQLVFQSGNAMGAPLAVPVAQAFPLEEFEVEVAMVAPQVAGPHVGYWRLSTAEGHHFGMRFWAEINVVATEPAADEAREAAVEPAPAADTAEAEDTVNQKLVLMTQFQREMDSYDSESTLPASPVSSRSSSDWEHVNHGEAGSAATTAQALHDLENSLAEAASSVAASAFGTIVAEGEAAEQGDEVEGDELGASFEGAALAGSHLAEEGAVMGASLTASMVTDLAGFDFEFGLAKWDVAVAELMDMGFVDVHAILTACEKLATPATFTARRKAIADELSQMA